MQLCNMNITIGYSPCPNDTFIFDALVNGDIPTDGLHFSPVLEDVQTLNEWALAGKLPFTKISYGVLPLITSQYNMLPSGGALGMGVGPILVTTPEWLAANGNATPTSVIIPGANTTAHLLFSWAYPQVTQKRFAVFHNIEDAILHGEADAGVIIHENRFTYQQKGLVALCDLGNLWEQQLQVPIPLGGIAVRKDVPLTIALRVNALIQQSIAYSWQRYPNISDYVQCHAQAMEPTVMQQHIELYVNDFSHHIGAKGKTAVNTLLQVYQQLQPQSSYNNAVFIEAPL